ncbi:unnamed protein product [Callosobruchus maculatus]|uniref:Uncharacterized protein n=1 Tax=Callosobruchus maculatus TaxID=64391 RepID=A0A653DQC3_CALMS|nr:unnamed protein product [Callosobruchus maculatus]
MPKHSRKRRRSRSSSRDRENQWLEHRLAKMQRQLDELNNRENQQGVARTISSPCSSHSSYGNLSPRHSVVIETAEVEVHPLPNDTEPNREKENTIHPQEGCQSNELKENSLGSDLLQMLGDEPAISPVHGPPIHEAIVTRWTNVLKNGLDETAKQDLLQKHLAPENFKSLTVPQLNPEVSAALTAQLLRRDERLVHKQQVLAAGISAVAQVLSSMLEEKEGGNTPYIQSLSNAGRLLCHLHYSETITRKELIAINLNKDLKDTLSDAPIDNFLFGEALEDRVKAAKNLEKSSEELKQVRPKVFKQPSQNPLNSRGPAQLQRGARAGQYFKKPHPAYRPYQQHHQKQKTRDPMERKQRDVPRTLSRTQPEKVRRRHHQ